MYPARLLPSLLLLPLLSLTGCCSLARFFCGPDTTPWVSVAYDTPEATLRTFLEAIRRDNAREVYFCLSRAYKEAKHLNIVTATVAWERLRAEIPGLHMLGYEPIPEQPTIAQDQGVTYEFDLDGSPLRVHLARQTFWEVRYRTAAGLPKDPGGYLDPTLNGHLVVEPAGFDDEGEPMSMVRLDKPVRFVHPASAQVPLEQFDRLTIGREWKIADLVLPQAQ
jgi:hypothetical protein